MSAAIEVRGLRKAYGRVEAVRGIDLSVERGEVFALLGPNGAGKTTSVEIMEGFRARDGGEVLVLGDDPARASREVRGRIGIVLQTTGLDGYLTVAETVDYYRMAYPSPRPLDEIVELVGLGAKRDERVLRLSGGQQRRLDVAVALAGDPELLFLDEPTTGFDPAARRGAWEIVRNLKALDKTVFLTTHYMDEAQELADRVAIIADGRIVAEGPPATLAGRDTAETRVSFGLPAGAALPPPLAAEAAAAAGTDGSGGTVVIRTDDPTRLLHELTSWAMTTGTALEHLDVRRPSLEDVYLELTRDARGDGEPAEAPGPRRRRGRR